MMQVLVCDAWVSNRIITERRRRGIDGHDEIWDGRYIVMPAADNEHQEIISGVGTVVYLAALDRARGDHCYMGVNVSDRNEDWLQNVRVPDYAAFLAGTRAIDRGTHWQGGPDFLMEIITRGDLTREKLAFYAQIGTREVLIVDRYPWALEWYVLGGKQLNLATRSTIEERRTLHSTVLPVGFRLVGGPERPMIEITRSDGSEHWLV